MYFIISKKYKVILGWSAKCGCSHIKRIFYFLENNMDVNIHTPHDYKYLPKNIENYIIILVIRNPYKRLVSGFLDKYNENGEFLKKWNINIPLTFSNFLDKIIERNTVIEKHHFTPQLSEAFEDRLKNHPNLVIYDIENIDYSYFEDLFHKKIPTELIHFKGGHERIPKIDVDINMPVFNKLVKEYYDYKISTKCFYNIKIKQKVYKHYQKDIDFFRERGFHYDTDIIQE
jgi:hypothetical protein